MEVKKENLVRGILLIIAFVLGGTNTKAEYLRIRFTSGFSSPYIRLGHVNGATEGGDGNYDAMYPPHPPGMDYIAFYFQNPYGWFMIDARGPYSTTNFYARIEGVSLGGSVNGNLTFSIWDDGQGNFDWKNFIVELYNNRDIRDPNNLIAVHDGYDLVAGSVSFSELNVSNGLSYQLLIKPRNHADLDLNGSVNWRDLSKLSSYWKTGDHDANDVWADYGDIDRNGIVDYNDLGIFSAKWLWDANDPNAWTRLLPAKARNPLPSDGAMDVSVSPYLSWTAGFCAESHDVYFGKANPPPFVINQNNTTFEPGPLSCATTYYWRIDELNPYGTTTGPVWSFTTTGLPDKARKPLPSDGAMDVSVSAYLSWTAGFCTESHDVYFGTANPPSFISNQNSTTFEPGALSPATAYYWRIDEINSSGKTTGLQWSFTTKVRPGQADNPSPGDGATGVPLDIDLLWTGGSDVESHDIYFGTSNPPAFRRKQTHTTFDPGVLAPVTTYFWRIDELNAGGTTTGEVWSFTTTTGTTSIFAWGNNGDRQCNIPAPNSGFIAIAAGGSHSLALKQDGSIVAWGSYWSCQYNFPSPNSDFIDIAAGGTHSLGLKQDGSIVAWGYNGDGQCNIPSPNTGFLDIAGGWAYTLALKADGSIAAWGTNYYGQCDIPSPNTGFIDIAAGVNHSLGLRVDGFIVAWGKSIYCDVPLPNSGFIAIAAGGEHSLGLKADGSIVAWGSNAYGQCNIPSPNTGFIGIAAGYIHSLGLKADGSILAWGDNTYGQCNIPPWLNKDFAAIAGGHTHNLAIKLPQDAIP